MNHLDSFVSIFLQSSLLLSAMHINVTALFLNPQETGSFPNKKQQ
ncbi:hypothetical protein [Acinetobacter sp. DSM 11652]|nr:hypothetical protein [Acinetobacter sp. DSM 11652]SEL97354.1 hypothetical protein SAMN05216500_108136 [Acinetobacter sp. DSM 11652]